MPPPNLIHKTDRRNSVNFNLSCFWSFTSDLSVSKVTLNEILILKKKISKTAEPQHR